MYSLIHDLVSPCPFELPRTNSQTIPVEVRGTGEFAILAAGNSVVYPNDDLLRIEWTLTDPDGRLIFQSRRDGLGNNFVAVTASMLDRVRTSAGDIRQPWTLTVTNPGPDDYIDVQLHLHVPATPEGSEGWRM